MAGIVGEQETLDAEEAFKTMRPSDCVVQARQAPAGDALARPG